MDYKEPKTRTELKGKNKEGKAIYNQKTVRMREAMMEKQKNKGIVVGFKGTKKIETKKQHTYYFTIFEMAKRSVESVIREIEAKGVKFIADKGYDNLASKLTTNFVTSNDPNKDIASASNVDANKLASASSLIGKDLLAHMSSGFDEFEKKTGRKPTYSEMREMWG